MRHLWTPEEVAYLRAQWPTLTTIGVIATALGRSEAAIYTKARDLGLHRGRIGRKKRLTCPRLRSAATAAFKERAPVRIDTSGIVSTALQARSELERAWGCS